MQSYDKFTKEIIEILKSDFLSSGNAIRNFLMFLANEPICREILHTANENVDLNEEFRKVFVEKQGLPKSPEKVVAVVTNVLYSLDTAKIALTAVLNSLYKDKSSNEAYDLFLEEIIVPYANEFSKLIKGEPFEEFSEPKQSAWDKMCEDLQSVGREIKFVLQNAKLPPNGAKAVTEATDGLVYSLQYRDPILTRYAYGAYLNALKLFDVQTGFEDDLAKILKLYGVL